MMQNLPFVQHRFRFAENARSADVWVRCIQSAQCRLFIKVEYSSLGDQGRSIRRNVLNLQDPSKNVLRWDRMATYRTVVFSSEVLGPAFFEVHADFAIRAFCRTCQDTTRCSESAGASALNNNKPLYLHILSSRLPVFCSPLV